MLVLYRFDILGQASVVYCTKRYFPALQEPLKASSFSDDYYFLTVSYMHISELKRDHTYQLAPELHVHCRC